MASSGAGASGSGMSVEDQMRDEIARLTATINQHKSGQKPPSSNASSSGYGSYNSYSSGGYGHNQYHGGYRGRGRGRGGVIMGGGGAGGGPHKQYVRPGLVTPSSGAMSSVSGKGKENASVGTGGEGDTAVVAGGVEEKAKAGVGRKEVIIGGVAFEASKRSLVRKDLATTKSKTKKSAPQSFARKGPHGHMMPRSRMYKPKGRNMTLDNTGRTYSRPKKATIRKIDKPCSRFTKTGTCSRGLTCPYQHDPNKIAICWNFMQGDCPKTADTCNLSHNPTPERTPLCVHFLNRGRCTKENCLFPHVNVGKKEGVCKDFAVLGYCEKGVECDRNHVRECPEFEETGECRTKGCKLPHVIKANARWAKRDKAVEEKRVEVEGVDGGEKALTAESGNLGDEYISLIFNESDESESSEEEGEEEDEEDGEEDGEKEESGGEMEVHG